MADDKDTVKLPSGREFYAYNGIVGIGANGDPADLWVWEGYDGDVSTYDWSVEERRELADLMLARWQAYRDSLEV
jgi:hypothetical protein